MTANLKAPAAGRDAVDLDRIRPGMSAEEMQRVREEISGGKRSGVRATPTFFINGRIRDVSFGLQALADGVERALRQSSQPT